jgi:hypothetical protein
MIYIIVLPIVYLIVGSVLYGLAGRFTEVYHIMDSARFVIIIWPLMLIILIIIILWRMGKTMCIGISDFVAGKHK